MSITTQEQRETMEEFTFPPNQQDFMEIEAIEELDDGINEYEMWLEEQTEAYLGTTLFENLEQRFSALPGIDEVIHEDRERFIIVSSLMVNELNTILWSEFIKVATEAKAALDNT